MTLRIFIVDDEGPARRGLVEMVQASTLDVEVVGQAASVEEAVEGIRTSDPDLLLLDIHLGKGNGFDLLERLGEEPPMVVFVTAHDQYALRAFRLAAVDYLLKPITSSMLQGTLQRALERTDRTQARTALGVLRNNRSHPKEPRIAIATSDGLHLFDPRQLVRCESENNYTTLFDANGRKLVCARTLKDFDELLEPYGFVRAHASHLVNLLAVKRYSARDGGFLELNDGTRIPVAQRKRQLVLDALSALGG